MLKAQLSYYGHFHDEYSLTLSKICVLQEKLKNYEAALECKREMFDLKKRTLAPNDPSLLATKAALERFEDLLRV